MEYSLQVSEIRAKSMVDNHEVSEQGQQGKEGILSRPLVAFNIPGRSNQATYLLLQRF